MNEMVLLQSIERRIQNHMQGAYANIVEVGRCLIEAKESGVVPHGQFEEWAGRVTGLQKRSYQRLMQVAREVSPDSAMAKLPITKITAILSLPEAQREEVAEKAVEENQSLRKLKLEIEGLRMNLEQARESEKQARERSAWYADNAIAARLEAEKARDALQKAMDNPPVASGISAEAQAEIDGLKKRLEEEQNMNRADIDHMGGLLRQSEKKVDALELEKGELAAKLADAERMAEYQAQQREQAQQELLDLRTQTARGELPAREDLTAEAVSMAARTFIGAVGYVPHSDRLLTMSEAERDEIATYAAMLREWSENVLHTVNMARQTVVIGEV